jgi:hypothetical protein
MFSTLVQIELPKKDDVIDLELFSDMHVGHVGFNEELFLHRMDAVLSNPLRFTAFMGDQGDFISAKDKRWDKEAVAIEGIDAQRAYWQKLIQPLADEHKFCLANGYAPKVWWLHAGNHEYKVTDQDYIKNQFCLPNEFTYLGSRGMIGVEVSYQGEVLRRWKILSIHGGGGGSNPLTALDQMKANHYADIFLMGHLHDKVIQPQAAIDFSFDVGKWIKRDIIVANTGTFLDTFTDGIDGYMDRKNKVRRAKLGTITISFDAYKGKLHAHE